MATLDDRRRRRAAVLAWIAAAVILAGAGVVAGHSRGAAAPATRPARAAGWQAAPALAAAAAEAPTVRTEPARPRPRAASRQVTHARAPRVAVPARHRVPRSWTHAPRRDLRLIPDRTLLATMKHRAPGFSSSTARRPRMTVPRDWYGRTSVLPVLRRAHGRLEVRLSRRPNESTTWVRRRAVTLAHTGYAVLVDLSARHLYLFHRGVQQHAYPVGVGLPQTPTPTGRFFLAFHAPPNSPAYGSVMLETSAHSEAFQHFEGGNDAIIAIHGSIYSDAAIGDHGAAISNGCIRMHNWQLVKVARAPDGTPVVLTR